MRFGLKCILTLAILYRAILLSQGGWGTAALPSQLADAVPAAQARVRKEIADRMSAYCTSDPAACFARASGLASVVTSAAADTSEPRHSRHGAMAVAPH